ncbi:MAG: phytoene desaturase family protein [Hyphomicrobium sp.]
MSIPSCTQDSWDVLIIGGGHNGLTTAAYLARSGLRTLLLEKNPVVGGAAQTEEFYPQFRNSVASYAISLLDPVIIEELDLRRFGLKIVERPAANFLPLNKSRGLLWPYGTDARQRVIAEFSKRDAEQYPAYETALQNISTILRPFLLQPPPNAGGGFLELLKSIYIGSSLFSLSLEDKRILADLLTKSVSDFLGYWFENNHFKALLAFDGIVGTFASPSMPGTAYVLLHHCFGGVNGKPGVWGHALGGMGAITQAMEKSARASGAHIRVNSEVVRVRVKDKHVVGVELKDGEFLPARSVVSNIGPKLLFRDLLEDGVVSMKLRHRFSRIKTGSASFRMNVALSELPNFLARPGTNADIHHGAGIIIGPTLEYLDKAYLDACRQGWSQQPIIEMVIPSVIDPDLAPSGQHVASLFVQHAAPRLPHGRSWADQKEKEHFADCVIATVTRYAPNFKRAIIARQILSPLDLEQRYGLIDGDIFHGQLSYDQLFSLRPVLGFAKYRMPVSGLYLCGSGAHPGGGVSGLPGRNAAREILKDHRIFI